MSERAHPRLDARIRRIVREEIHLFAKSGLKAIPLPPKPIDFPHTPERWNSFLASIGVDAESRRPELIEMFPDQVELIDQLIGRSSTLPPADAAPQ